MMKFHYIQSNPEGGRILHRVYHFISPRSYDSTQKGTAPGNTATIETRDAAHSPTSGAEPFSVAKKPQNMIYGYPGRDQPPFKKWWFPFDDDNDDKPLLEKCWFVNRPIKNVAWTARDTVYFCQKNWHVG